jgi:beta-galactosidase
MNDVKFALQGPATIAGVANGDHHFPAEFDADHVSLFYGKAMLVLRTAEGKPGAIRVSASSPGVREAIATIKVR